MKVSTIREHHNDYAPMRIKRLRRKYEVPDKVGRALISAGYVEEDAAVATEDQA